jgi:two-component system, cell cycle sensor histidine kinase and response regulator CckA
MGISRRAARGRQAEASLQFASSVLPHVESRGTILLVDDDETARDVAGEILSSAGFQVIAAGTATEGLRVLDENRGPIDLIVTDVLMPGMDGFAFAATVKKSPPKLPILFISGYSKTPNLDGALGPMLAKPFSAEQLEAKAEAVLMQLRGNEKPWRP